MVLALALLSASIVVQGFDSNFGIAGNGGVDILGDGIFETDISGIRFPAFQDTNIDSLNVGNDKAMAFGTPWQGSPIAKATNNLEIKKNQDSGECVLCTDEFTGSCVDNCTTKVNIETINVGNRDVMAFGFATATNNIKIVTNQQ
jgi:hypothetical protein